MALKKRYLSALLTCGIGLTSCETPQPQPFVDLKTPLSFLKAKREIPPALAYAFQLLREEKYTEASQFINISLQSQPKNTIFHILNALTYEKLAEKGDATGLELAAIGYQNAINLDSSNTFAITQLAKLKSREKQYEEAQELFANALLLKPNDADLLHELAAASYYAYDIKTALSAIKKAEKFKPNDPLIHRSATMIYAALGDFTTAKKHLDIFQEKAGKDPSVAHMVARFNDWQILYKSGRFKPTPATLTLASSPSSNTNPLKGLTSSSPSGKEPLAVTTPPPSGTSGTSTPQNLSPPAIPAIPPIAPTPPIGTPPPSNEATPPSGATPPASGGQTPSLPIPSAQQAPETPQTPPTSPQSAPPSGGDNVAPPPPSDSEGAGDSGVALENEAEDVLGMPMATEDATSQGPQIIVDCYMLRVTEEAQTSKGNNILQNLAVTLNPGNFAVFRGQLGGSGAAIPTPGTQQNQNAALLTADTGFKPNQSVQSSPPAGAASAFTPATTGMNLYNKGAISGTIFASGITWAGLTYSLNIANAIDRRTEIVSRPSLMTFLQKQSVFFSGDELVLGLAGQFGGTLTKYPVGVTLIVTPESLKDDLLTLNITIEGSLLTDPNPNLSQTVTVGKTRVDTFAKVRLGETLMLGGLYERVDALSKDGFPGLRDIPIAQYFFSNESTLSARRSIIFMLTPRSPDLVKSAVNRAMARNVRQPSLSELEQRNPDWFNSTPNLVALFISISRNPIIYYEFRSGDVIPPSWGWEPTLNTKLEELQSFLYY